MNQPQSVCSTAVYVASALANEIAVFVLNVDDGRLELIERVSLPAGITPLTCTPDRRFLFAGLRGEQPAVIAFAIDPVTARLRLLGTTPLPDPPMYLATDAGGKFLLSASYAAGAFAINPIAEGGRVEAAPVQRTQTPPHTHAIRTDPTDRFLFVTSLAGDAILQYAFDASTGRAIPNATPSIPAPRGTGPRHLTFHPNGDVLYVNGELDGSIRSYALGADTGRLRALESARILPDASIALPWAAELAIGPDGKYLYATERRTNTLALFDLAGAPGALRRKAIVETEEQPRSFAIEPRGRFLIVAGETSNHVAVYRIDSSTAMPLAQFRCPVGAKPVWITIVDRSAALA